MVDAKEFVVGKSYKCVGIPGDNSKNLTVGKYYEYLTKRPYSLDYFITINDKGDQESFFLRRFDVNDCLEDKMAKNMNIIQQANNKLTIGFKQDIVGRERIIPGLFMDDNRKFIVTIVRLNPERPLGSGFVVDQGVMPRGETQFVHEIGYWSDEWNLEVMTQVYGDVTLSFKR